VYLRLVSVPWTLGFEPAPVARLEPGRGRVVRDDGPVVVVCTGPVLASQAWAAAESVGGAAVVLLPWLRGIDGPWLAAVAGDRPVLVLDNHVVDGGQVSAVRAALPDRTVHVVGVDGVPACGTNEEVLAHHRLDGPSIAARLLELGARGQHA
jgi:transketolase C-terminal domain/subunit